MKYPKGSYVVLLHGWMRRMPNSSPHSLPINYVYQLREDYTNYNFRVNKDLEDSTENGWFYMDVPNKEPYDSALDIRYATENEIKRYKSNGCSPVPADKIIYPNTFSIFQRLQ